jgi:ATPase subunit of ABC transporter with duplicated ATPase domains
VDRLSGGNWNVVPVYRFNSESKLLILDEPTNDLDIVTLNVLESFL